jgi:hypothetical protein
MVEVKHGATVLERGPVIAEAMAQSISRVGELPTSSRRGVGVDPVYSILVRHREDNID